MSEQTRDPYEKIVSHLMTDTSHRVVMFTHGRATIFSSKHLPLFSRPVTPRRASYGVDLKQGKKTVFAFGYLFRFGRLGE